MSYSNISTHKSGITFGGITWDGTQNGTQTGVDCYTHSLLMNEKWILVTSSDDAVVYINVFMV